jgi:hypothetical protein
MSIRGFFRASRANNSLGHKLETTLSILYDTSSSITNTAAFLHIKKQGWDAEGEEKARIIPALEKCSTTKPHNPWLVSQR